MRSDIPDRRAMSGHPGGVKDRQSNGCGAVPKGATSWTMGGSNDDFPVIAAAYPRGGGQRRPKVLQRSARRHVRDAQGDLAHERQRTLLTEVLVFVLFVCSSAQVLGPLAVAAQLGILACLLILHRRDLPMLTLRALPFLAIGIWATASTFWSTDAGVSARYGSQFLATLVIGVVVAGAVSASRLPVLIFLGTSVVLLLSILSGRYGQSEGGFVLIGLTGSKNAFAYLCLLNAMCAIAILAGIGSTARVFRLAAIGMLPIALLYLATGQAASAQVQCLLGIGLFGGLIWARHVRRATRAFVLACVLIAGLGSVAALPQLDELSTRFRTDVLKKDTTLTGRTYLWGKADELIEQRPAMGWGYRSTWLGSTAETIGLLRWAKLTDGRGFNFHNTVKELRVDLGIVGLILFFAPLALALARLSIEMFVRPSIEATFALIMVTLVGVVRAQTETILGAFGTDMILLTALIYYGARYWSRRAAPSHDRAGGSPYRAHRGDAVEQTANDRHMARSPRS